MAKDKKKANPRQETTELVNRMHDPELMDPGTTSVVINSDVIESITKGDRGINIVKLRNGLVFQIHDAEQIPQAIREMGDRATSVARPFTPSTSSQIIRSASRSFSQSISAATGRSVTDPRAIEEINRLGKERVRRDIANMDNEDLDDIITLYRNAHVDRGEQINIQTEIRAKDEEFCLRKTTVPERCEWCQTIFNWTLGSGPMVCKEECGEKLATLYLEHPEIQELKNPKRAIMIQSYKELMQ